MHLKQRVMDLLASEAEIQSYTRRLLVCGRLSMPLPLLCSLVVFWCLCLLNIVTGVKLQSIFG